MDTKPHNGLIVPKTWVFDNDTTGAPMSQSIIQVVHGTRMLVERSPKTSLQVLDSPNRPRIYGSEAVYMLISVVFSMASRRGGSTCKC